jgi:hypothetical protein
VQADRDHHAETSASRLNMDLPRKHENTKKTLEFRAFVFSWLENKRDGVCQYTKPTS